jgi:hypothetical protein
MHETIRTFTKPSDLFYQCKASYWKKLTTYVLFVQQFL